MLMGIPEKRVADTGRGGAMTKYRSLDGQSRVDHGSARLNTTNGASKRSNT